MKNKTIDLPVGKYVVEVSTLKKDLDEPSAMAPYLSHHCIVTKEEDKIFITFMILNEHVITGLQIKNEAGVIMESINHHVDESSKTRYEIFHFEQLNSHHEAQVQYEVDHEGEVFKGDETLRLYFNENSAQNVEDLKFK